MINYLRKKRLNVIWPIAGIVLLPICLQVAATPCADEHSSVATSVGSAGASAADDSENVRIEAIETPSPDDPGSNRDMAWLGVSTREASEDLTSQLDLEPGVGLVLTYVGPESPAGKAGLKKHDVLTQFGGQALVHPAQLRKLVRVHKAGDEIKLVFYRNGKQKTATVTLGKTETRAGVLPDEGALHDNFLALQDQLKDLHLDEAMKQQMQAMRESMGKIKIDQKKVQEEIRRSMEQASQAMREAMRTATNADFALNPVRKMLENMANSSIFVDKNAHVTVRSSGKGVKSLVNTDDSGTIILINQPKLHLTAHDQDGRLIFDGPIETEQQRAKVPRDLWERVEPLLEKMESGPPEDPEKKDEQ